MKSPICEYPNMYNIQNMYICTYMYNYPEKHNFTPLNNYSELISNKNPDWINYIVYVSTNYRRLREGLVHFYEKDDDGRIIMIKEYKRSAAGTELCRVNNLRTMDALRLTTNYLLKRYVSTFHSLPSPSKITKKIIIAFKFIALF